MHTVHHTAEGGTTDHAARCRAHAARDSRARRLSRSRRGREPQGRRRSIAFPPRARALGLAGSGSCSHDPSARGYLERGARVCFCAALGVCPKVYQEIILHSSGPAPAHLLNARWRRRDASSEARLRCDAALRELRLLNCCMVHAVCCSAAALQPGTEFCLRLARPCMPAGQAARHGDCSLVRTTPTPNPSIPRDHDMLRQPICFLAGAFVASGQAVSDNSPRPRAARLEAHVPRPALRAVGCVPASYLP